MIQIPKANSKINSNRFSPYEIISKLRKCGNTAPGPEGITYAHLRKIDPNATVLTPIYNLCLRFQAVPETWKKTTTISIHEKRRYAGPRQLEGNCPR